MLKSHVLRRWCLVRVFERSQTLMRPPVSNSTKCCGRQGALAIYRSFLFLWILAGIALAQSPNKTTPSTGTIVQESSPNLPELTTHEEIQTFQVKVNLVEVRVVVRDAHGNAVGNLKKQDFQLFDNGKPQVISKFSVEQGTAGTAAAEATTTQSAGTQNPNAPAMPHRYVSYLFDDIHLSAGDVILVRNAAKTHLQALSADDRAAIYTTSGQVMLDFTDDHDKLYSTLARIKPVPVHEHQGTGCPNISPYQADLILNKHDEQALRVAVLDFEACAPMAASAARKGGDAEGAREAVVREAEQVMNAVRWQTGIAFDTLRSVIGRTAETVGQKMIVLVSPGFLLDNTDLLTEVQIVDKALRANVIISALDARGLYTLSPAGDISKSMNPILVQYLSSYESSGALAQEHVLEELSNNTGGTFFHNNNDLELGLRKITALPECSYMLGFAPQNLKSDGSFHTLKVSVSTGQKLSLQARKGYFAPKKNEDAAEQAKNEIEEQVFSQEVVRELPITLKTQFFKVTANSARLAVLVQVDVQRMQFRKAEGRNTNDLTIVSVLFDRNGNVVTGNSKTVQMHIKDETLTKLNSGITVKSNFDVSPGSYIIRVVARDQQGKLAAHNDVIEIP